MEYRTIKEGATVYSGFAFKRTDLSPIGDYQIIKIGNLVGRTVDYSKTDYISKSLISDKHNKYFLNNKDVLIAMTGQGSVGRVAQLRKKEQDTLLLNQRVGKFVCNETLDNDYLFYVLSSARYQELLFNLGYGSGQPNLSPETILNVSIPFPTLKTQQRIASILSTLEDKIAINTAINENLEQQAQAIFKAWFVDFEPFGGVMPDDWIETTLGDVTRNIRTKINNNKTPVFSAVNSGNLVYSDDYFNKQVYSKDISKYIKVDNWDFAYNPARINIGSIGINDLGVIGCVSPVYVVFSVQEEYHSFFRFFFRQEQFKQQSLTRASGSVRQTLNYTDFSLIDVIYPNSESAKRFDIIWKSYYSVIERLRKENEKLSALRDTLLPKLMNGEIDVSKIRI